MGTYKTLVRLTGGEAAEGLSDDEFGAFLRHKGLHEAHLARWCAAMQSALERAPKKRSGNTKEVRKIREWRRSCSARRRRWPRASALLVLIKKPGDLGERLHSVEERRVILELVDEHAITGGPHSSLPQRGATTPRSFFAPGRPC